MSPPSFFVKQEIGKIVKIANYSKAAGLLGVSTQAGC